MMDQTHIGYTYWQQPNERVRPETKTVDNSPNAEMGVAIEGSEKFWSTTSNDAILPEFNSYQKSTHYFEIFNRGKAPFDFSISSKLPWLKFSESKGTIDKEKRITVSVDWSKTPSGVTENPISITGENGKQIVVIASIRSELFMSRICRRLKSIFTRL